MKATCLIWLSTGTIMVRWPGTFTPVRGIIVADGAALEGASVIGRADLDCGAADRWAMDAHVEGTSKAADDRLRAGHCAGAFLQRILF